ncbi:MAG: alpha/beta hydrolase [Proteobacteria bacterium]|nr:alpha/beta hydrolase [Pseudomonadota bacterium]
MLKTMTIGLLGLALSGCAPSILKEEYASINEYYETHDNPDFLFGQYGTLKLRYLETGDPNKSAIVFIHGTPGSWTAFASYLNEPALQQEAHLFAVDRPGWGGSIFSDNQFEPSVAVQSQLMKDWLCEIAAGTDNGQLILVGHSLGGTLAPRLAMDHPDCVSGVLILAGPMDPKLASPRWYNYLALIPPFGWLADRLEGGMRKSNKEMMLLKSELENMQPLWADMKMPVIVMQGGKDGLVNARHADFAEKMITGAKLDVIRLPKADHFFLYANKPLVLQQIRLLLHGDVL